MRGFVTLFMMVLMVIVIIGVVGIPAIEGVGEAVIDTGMIPTEHESTIENIYQSAFVRVPLIAIAGTFVWAVLWYLRRQQTTGVR